MASSLCLLPFFLLSLSSLVSSSTPTLTILGNEEFESVGHELYKEFLRDEAVSRLNELGKVSDVDGYLERTFMSPASIQAANVIRKWMEDAGLRTWVDHMGNVHGRVDGINADAPALLIGSHMDTVVDAGKFDGALGIVSAISALKVLKVIDKLEKLRRPVEIVYQTKGEFQPYHTIPSSQILLLILLLESTKLVIAFSDEEGVRFQSTFLGSAAISGILPGSSLNISDKRGKTLQDVLKENSIEATEETLLQLKYQPQSVWGYVEIHIEQGPVLELAGLPLAVVKGIAGQTRLKVTVSGSQGHAGTVPMAIRRDPMAAAAELIVLLESLCKQPQKFLPSDGECGSFESLSGSLVCTVGEMSLWPSASNVIPGQVTFTIDLRAMDDAGREAVLYELSKNMYNICDKRSVSCVIERKHDANAVNCDSELSSQLNSAALSAFKKMAGDIQNDVPKLMSGAGHDAMAMSHLTKMGMLFVRCRGGVSHSPAEHVLDDDVWSAGLALLAFLESHL